MGLFCSGRKFDDNGKIIGYTLVNECGEVIRVSSAELKENMINGRVSVDNLKLSKDGKILLDKSYNTHETQNNAFKKRLINLLTKIGSDTGIKFNDKVFMSKSYNGILTAGAIPLDTSVLCRISIKNDKNIVAIAYHDYSIDRDPNKNMKRKHIKLDEYGYRELVRILRLNKNIVNKIKA